MTDSDSRKTAAQAVLRQYEARIAEVENEIARAVLTEDFMERILDYAWRYQFRENRSEFRSSVKSLVADEVERRVMEEQQ